MKILIIDDNEVLSGLYEKIIAGEGYEISVENKSDNALERIRAEKPDIVLLDIMMEPLSGWEVLEQVRDDPDLHDTLVIILTGKMMTIEEAVTYGMQIDGFVLKPLEKSMLVTAIQDAITILSASEERYRRAAEAGMSADDAALCQRMYRKRCMLEYLKDFIGKQERMLQIRPGVETEYNDIILELKRLIERNADEFDRIEKICP
ncbi:MAG: response regulator [Methanospirillaceae archaeon]|nr:response regulator [Methanospirillaceae archaeon]